MIKKMLVLCMCMILFVSSAAAAVPPLPNPESVMDSPKVEQLGGVRINDHINGGNQQYRARAILYTFDAAPSGIAGHMPGLSEYSLLLRLKGFQMKQEQWDLTYRDYRITYNGDTVAFLQMHYSEWQLLLLDGMTLAEKAEWPAGGSSDWTPDGYIPSGSSGTARRCGACRGTGDCVGCHGDGVFDNMYEPNLVSACRQCGKTGICQVCDGTGYYD